MREIKYKGKKYTVTDEEFNDLFCKNSNGYDWKDENGKLVAVEHIQTEEEKKQNEINNLKDWFSNVYAYKEQKYRRLHTLCITEKGKSAYDLLIELYKEAETKRKRIQELGG